MYFLCEISIVTCKCIVALRQTIMLPRYYFRFADFQADILHALLAETQTLKNTQTLHLQRWCSLQIYMCCLCLWSWNFTCEYLHLLSVTNELILLMIYCSCYWLCLHVQTVKLVFLICLCHFYNNMFIKCMNVLLGLKFKIDCWTHWWFFTTIIIIMWNRYTQLFNKTAAGGCFTEIYQKPQKPHQFNVE